MLGVRIFQGGFVEVYTEWRNRTKTLTDPSILTLQVIKPDGSNYWPAAKTLGDWSKESTGIFFFFFQSLETDPVGVYHVIAKATVSGIVDPRAASFSVVTVP